MPYITMQDRLKLADGRQAATAGELNYLITDLCDTFLATKGRKYEHVNAVIGALECAKQEFYRRIASPYENEKIAENGDVYSDDILPAPGAFVTLPQALTQSNASVRS
jgi:hypothetical protein